MRAAINKEKNDWKQKDKQDWNVDFELRKQFWQFSSSFIQLSGYESQRM